METLPPPPTDPYELRLEQALHKAVKRALKERPANALVAIGEWLLEASEEGNEELPGADEFDPSQCLLRISSVSSPTPFDEQGGEEHDDVGVYEGERNQAGEPEGVGTLVSPRGDRYEGQWRAGARDGHGTCNYASGDMYVGQWKGDDQDGTGMYTYADGEAELGQYREGADAGEAVRFSADRAMACRLLDGEVQAEIGVEEGRKLAARIGLSVPPPAAGSGSGGLGAIEESGRSFAQSLDMDIDQSLDDWKDEVLAIAAEEEPPAEEEEEEEAPPPSKRRSFAPAFIAASAVEVPATVSKMSAADAAAWKEMQAAEAAEAARDAAAAAKRIAAGAVRFGATAAMEQAEAKERARTNVFSEVTQLASALKQGAEASSLSSPSKVRRASLGQSPPKQAAQEEQTPPPAPQTPQTAQVTDEDLALAERIAAAAASANKKGGRRKSAMVGQIAMAAQMGLVHQAEAKAPASATPQAAAAPHANLLALTSRADAHLSSRPHAQSVAPRPPPVAERAARLPQAAPPKTKRKSITTMFQGKGRGGRVVGSTVISTSNHEFCVWPSAPPDGKYAQHKEGDTGSTDAKPFTLPAGFRPASVADADFAGMNAEVIAAHGWSTLHLAVAKSGSFGQDGRGWALYYSKNTEGEGKERAPGMEVEYDEQDVSYARALGGDRFVVTDGDIRMLLRRDGV